MSIKDDYQEFKKALNDLKFNSKPQINFLTILAEEKIANGEQVVRAIDERILELKGEAVLPVLYVLDSIVKNLRSTNYSQLFEPRLPILFASAFNKVDEKTRLAMYKLRQTWTPYFSNLTLHNLDTRTHYIDPAWPITARQPDPSATTNHIHPNAMNKSDDSDRSATKPTSSRDDNYNMIPIDRARSTLEHINEKNSDHDPPVKASVINEKRDPRQAANLIDSTLPENSNSNKTKAPTLNDTPDPPVDTLFGGNDIDYRDTGSLMPSKGSSNPPNSDTDRIFELNNRCFSLAEEKYKSKELSTEEYQATLKLLQTILQNEAQRLVGGTVPNLTTVPFVNNNNASAAPSFSTQPFLPLPYAGFGYETQRHVSQILATVGASVPYPSPFNLISYLPPLPPAPPVFSLVQNSFPNATSAATGASATGITGRQSPPVKRPHEENTSENSTIDEEAKRKRVDSIIGPSHNFDEENIAPVPSLIDANIHTLKKKYLGVIQQLYIGKYQCRACGLRFTSKQKDAYNCHLDWHFWENQQASAAAARFQSSRDWYPSLPEWTVHEENLDEQIRNHQLLSKQSRHQKDLDLKKYTSTSSTEFVSCPAKSNGDADDDRCYVCHDPFENFFDDNREEWHLKDAIRVDGKTYHPICYQDAQHQASHEKDSKLFTDLFAQRNSSNQPDSQTVETALATAKIKSETEDSYDEDEDEHASSDEQTRPTYLSSMSFVNLVESIYVKKEDVKPMENQENLSSNHVKDEPVDSSDLLEEIPFLGTKHEADCDFAINPSADAIGTSSD